MSMTKKDYELIASVIKKQFSYDTPEMVNNTLVNVAKDLAHELESTNPAFDYNKFLMACGVIT